MLQVLSGVLFLPNKLGVQSFVRFKHWLQRTGSRCRQRGNFVAFCLRCAMSRYKTFSSKLNIGSSVCLRLFPPPSLPLSVSCLRSFWLVRLSAAPSLFFDSDLCLAAIKSSVFIRSLFHNERVSARLWPRSAETNKACFWWRRAVKTVKSLLSACCCCLPCFFLGAPTTTAPPPS